MTNTATNMISYLSITVFMVMFSTFGLTDYGWDETPDSLDTIEFDYDKDFKLSEDGRVALHELLKAESYSYMRVGVGGHYSQEYDNFAILMHEENAINAFKQLVMDGTDPAQVFGLIGLKIKNPKLIEDYKPILSTSIKTINAQGGCSSWNVKVSSLLYRKNTSGKRNMSFDWFEEDLNRRYQWLKQNHKLFNVIGI